MPDFLNPSDVLVLNDTRVIRARIRGRLERSSGTSREVEVLFAAPAGENTWEVMVRPGKRVREGDLILFSGGELQGVFGSDRSFGLRLCISPLQSNIFSRRTATSRFLPI